jgi:hypothetical protein
MLVEALASGRNAIGTDIDPLAVFATAVKTRRYSIPRLLHSKGILDRRLALFERSPQRYLLGQFEDIKPASAIAICKRHSLWIPPIPRLFEWFRAYVVVDLARILAEIQRAPIPESHRNFFRLAFAAIIRQASNADPVPVSGLEITSHMRRLDALGRIVNPYDLFRTKVEKAIPGAAEFNALVPPGTYSRCRVGDAARLGRHVRGQVSAIITSPPYNNAVDYHRRHMLEVYWLGLVRDSEERRALRSSYIGQGGGSRHPFVAKSTISDPLCTAWHTYIKKTSATRAAAFKHYVVSMERMFAGTARVLPKGGLALFVLGHSSWNGDEIPTSDLFEALAGSKFNLVEKLWYPLRNRSMSYKRKNGADINREYVLVFRRTISE